MSRANQTPADKLNNARGRNASRRNASGRNVGERSLVVIPTYEERENLSRLVPVLLESVPELDVLVIDDASPDGTGELADRLAAGSGRVHVRHRTGKQGLGTAYVEGFRYALEHGYGYVVQMDADFSHLPQDVPRLLKELERSDVAVGSRSVPGGRVENWSFLRRLVSKGGSVYARAVLGLPVKDTTAGFKAFRREALESIDFEGVAANGYGFQVEMNHLCHREGFRISEIPVVFPDRTAGESKMSPGIFLEAAALVLKLRYRTLTRNTPAKNRGESPATGERRAVAGDAGSR